ncbi:hypothetical protein NSMM_800070 [Nitrosomonas mobilis]|uniref:Uncharacterized protein n=1 Tax=Nitrosomonas mobilis TaxID=51642 RepID=A0A1G5SI36_9PROT|nr:hypothetical protein NSMM_800070 [Nitrosomonas mobilis]
MSANSYRVLSRKTDYSLKNYIRAPLNYIAYKKHSLAYLMHASPAFFIHAWFCLEFLKAPFI